MSRVELNFVATGNFSNLKNQIDQVRRSVEQINKNAGKVGLDASQTNRIKEMAASYDKLVQSSGQFRRQVVQLQSANDKFGAALQNQTLKLGQYFTAIREHHAKTSGSIKSLAEQQVRLQNSLIRTDPFSGKVFVDTPRKIDAIRNASALAKKEQELYNLTLRNTSSALIKWGKDAQWAGRQLTVGLTVPIAMFGKTASDVFIKFDKELVRMQKVYGVGLVAASEGAIKNIRADVTGLANELAGAWGQSVDITAAMAADLAATGLEGNKLTAATKEASRISILGEVDRQAAVKTTVALQNVFKMSTKELTESMDYLIAVSNQSSLSLLDLTDAIPRAAPVIDELGGSYKDLAAMMAAMVEAGIPASEAANAIKSSVASMINPTKETRKQLNLLGIDLVGLVNQTGGKPVETFKLLATEMAKLDDLSRARAIEQIFGKFQFARIAALLDNINSKGTQTARVFDLMGASSDQLSNLAQANMKQVTDSVSGSYDRAMKSFQAAIIPIGEEFTKLFTSIFNLVTPIIQFISSNDVARGAAMMLALFVGLVGPIRMFTGLFGNFLGQIAGGIVAAKNFFNGFRGFAEIATAESVAAANAVDLYKNNMLQASDATGIAKLALEKLNLELLRFIGNQQISAGISMAPARAVQAQAAAHAATMSGAVGSSGYAMSNARLIREDIVTRGFRGQFAHAVPETTLKKTGLARRDYMSPAVGIYTAGAAEGLQAALNKRHMMETLLMTEMEASQKRLILYAEQSGISLSEAAKQFVGREQLLSQIYPSVTTLKGTIVRYLTMLKFVDEKLKTASSEETARISEAVTQIAEGVKNSDAASVARGSERLLLVAQKTAGSAQKFDIAMNQLVAQAVAKGNITDATIFLAQQHAQYTPISSPLSRLATTTGGGKIGNKAAAYLGAKPMLTDPSETSEASLLKQQRAANRESIRRNTIAQEALTLELDAQRNIQKDARTKYQLANEQQIASMQGNVKGLKKEEIILESAIINRRNYILALEGETQTLYVLDKTGKAVAVANQNEKGVIEAGIKNRLVAINTENQLNAKMAELSISTQEASLAIQQIKSRQAELNAPYKLLSKALVDEGISREKRKMLMDTIHKDDIAATQKIMILKDAEGNSILRLMTSQNELVRHYDMATGQVAISNKKRDLESIARNQQIAAIRQGIVTEKMGIDSKKVSLATTEKLLSLSNGDAAATQRLTAAKETLTAGINAHTAKIAELEKTENDLIAAKKREVLLSSNRARAAIIRDMNEKLSSLELSLSQQQRSQIMKELTMEETAIIKKVEVAQNQLGQNTILLKNQVGETIVAYELDQQGALRRAQVPPVPGGPGTRPPGGGFGGFLARPGVGMGGMMAGMAVSGIGMATNNSALTYGGMALGMLPMLSGLGAAVAPILAVVGALTALAVITKTVVDRTEEAARIFKNSYATSMSAGTIATEHFGLAVNDLVDVQLRQLVDVGNSSAESVKKLSESYAQASDQMIKDFLEKIKNADPKEATKLLVDKFTSDIISGMSRSQAKEDIAAILMSTGRQDLAFQMKIEIDKTDFTNSIQAFSTQSKTLTARAMENAGKFDANSYYNGLKSMNDKHMPEWISSIVSTANTKMKEMTVNSEQGTSGFFGFITDKVAQGYTNGLTKLAELEAGSQGGPMAFAVESGLKTGIMSGLNAISPGMGDVLGNIIGTGITLQAQSMAATSITKSMSVEDLTAQLDAAQTDIDMFGKSVINAFKTMPLEDFKTSFRSMFGDVSTAMDQSSPAFVVANRQFETLREQIGEISPDLGLAMEQMKDMGYQLDDISEAAGLALRGAIKDIQEFRRAAADPVYMDFIIRRFEGDQALSKAISDAQAAIADSQSGTTTKNEGDNRIAEMKAGWALEDKRAAEDKAIEDRYTALTEAQDKLIEKINKERDARRKLKEEQQANNEFLLTEMGLKKQINEALASGDISGAALLQQQLANEQDKKAADDKEKRLSEAEDKKIEAAEKEKKRLEKAKQAEIDALKEIRKQEDRNKQLADAAAQAATESAKAAKKSAQDSNAAAATALTSIKDRLQTVYFSTSDAAMKDSIISKLKDQLVALGVPAETANQLIKDIYVTNNNGHFTTEGYNTLKTALKDVASEATIAAIALEISGYMTANPGSSVDLAVSTALQHFLGTRNLDTPEGTALFNRIRAAVKVADGGPISGPGGPKDDRIPAMLSNGEYVIQADAVGHYGTGFFDAVNAKKYATGGLVMMGDSIMRDTDPHFTDTYAGSPVRKAYQGGITPTQAISKWGSSIKNWPNKIAVSLGTNGPGPYPTGHFEPGFNASKFDAEIEKVMDLAGTSRDVYWYTNVWNKAQKYNSTISSVNSRHPNMHIVDVANLVKSHPNWIIDDNGNQTSWSNMGKHPAPGAYSAIASLLMSRLGTGGSGGGSGDSSSYPPKPWHSYVKYKGGNRDFPALMKWASGYAGQIDYAHKDSQGGYSDLAFNFPDAFKKGFGCSNFTHAVLKEIGMNLDAFSPSQMTYGSLVTKDYRQTSKMKPGDLVFWRTANGPQGDRGAHDPNHVAFYYGGGRILQSSGGRGVNISNIYGPNGTGVGNWGFLQTRRLANTVVSSPAPSTPRTPPTSNPTPNPTPAAPRASGQIPFSAATGNLKGFSDFSPMGRNITSTYGMGGVVMPKYHTGGRVAYAKGGEVAALLQSGETVLTGQLTDRLTPLLESIADGKMGMGDITNNIVINGANKSPEQIAELVVQKINATMSRQIRTNRVM